MGFLEIQSISYAPPISTRVIYYYVPAHAYINTIYSWFLYTMYSFSDSLQSTEAGAYMLDAAVGGPSVVFNGGVKFKQKFK